MDGMLPWLARAATEARKDRRRKQVHVAASLDRDQSTVARFEKGKGWPQNPDEMVAAYADDLEVSPLEIWQRALALWEASTGPEVLTRGGTGVLPVEPLRPDSYPPTEKPADANQNPPAKRRKRA